MAKIPLVAFLRRCIRRLRGWRLARPAVEAIDRVWWARVIRGADIIDLDLVQAQGFTSPRAALRAYVRGGFRTGVSLNPLAMERLIASQLSDVGRVPALYAYLTNDSRRIRVNVSWDAVAYAERHPESVSAPGGPLGHRWRRARAEGTMELGHGDVTTHVRWAALVKAMDDVAHARAAGPTQPTPCSRVFICEVADDEPDLAYALDAVISAASREPAEIIFALHGRSTDAWLACALVTLWRPYTRFVPGTERPEDDLSPRSDGVVVVRGPRAEISAESLLRLAESGSHHEVAPLWLDDDGTIASAGLIIQRQRYRHLLSGHPAEDALAGGMEIDVPRVAGITHARPIGSRRGAPGRTLTNAVVRVGRTAPPSDVVAGADTDIEPYLRPAGLTASGSVTSSVIRRRNARGATLLSPTPRLRWAIKTAAPPGRPGEFWGDTHFARGIADALRRLGQDVIVDAYVARSRATSSLDDVVLALRGPEPIEAQSDAASLLWIISHPDEITAAQLDGFDAVFAASSSWAERSQVRFGRTIESLLQCTDPHRFHPVGLARTSERVFVGTARGIARPSVVEPLRAGLQLSVYGPDWTGYIPAHAVVARSVPNAELPALYESAGVVMNDHWPAMQRAGFVSNRLFDVVAAGGRAVSDSVDGIDEIFDGAVVTYKTIEELLALLRRPDDEVFPSPEHLSRVSARVRAEHSFDARARRLLQRAIEIL